MRDAGKETKEKGEARRVNGSGKNEGEKATANETLMRRADACVRACGCTRIHSRALTTASISSQTSVVDPRQVVGGSYAIRLVVSDVQQTAERRRDLRCEN